MSPLNVQKTSMGTSETRHEEWGNLGLKGWALGRDEKPPPIPGGVTRLWAPQAQEHQGPVGASEAQFYSVSEHPRISSSVLSPLFTPCASPRWRVPISLKSSFCKGRRERAKEGEDRLEPDKKNWTESRPFL